MATNVTSFVSIESAIPNRWVRKHAVKFRDDRRREPAMGVGTLPQSASFKLTRQPRCTRSSPLSRTPEIIPNAQDSFIPPAAVGRATHSKVRSFTAVREGIRIVSLRRKNSWLPNF